MSMAESTSPACDFELRPYRIEARRKKRPGSAPDAAQKPVLQCRVTARYRRHFDAAASLQPMATVDEIEQCPVEDRSGSAWP